MASGDNIKYRGKLTKELTEGLLELITRTPVMLVSDIHVSFFDRLSSRIVVMSLPAALEALTYDIASHGQFDWSQASTLLVGATMGHQIRSLRT